MGSLAQTIATVQPNILIGVPTPPQHVRADLRIVNAPPPYPHQPSQLPSETSPYRQQVYQQSQPTAPLGPAPFPPPSQSQQTEPQPIALSGPPPFPAPQSAAAVVPSPPAPQCQPHPASLPKPSPLSVAPNTENVQIGYFVNVRDPNGHNELLQKCLYAIRSGHWADKIAHLRASLPEVNRAQTVQGKFASLHVLRHYQKWPPQGY